MGSSIYTRTGDKGETGLVSGKRVSKSDQRIDLYGEVDELNSWIGVVHSALKEPKNPEFDLSLKTLEKIQAELFSLGSKLACPTESWDTFKLPDLKQEMIDQMESEIDQHDKELPSLKNFILPGGSRAGSYLHVARTICRRVERKLVHFQAEEGEENTPPLSIQTLNRLSDYFFSLARFVNFKLGQEEIKWTP